MASAEGAWGEALARASPPPVEAVRAAGLQLRHVLALAAGGGSSAEAAAAAAAAEEAPAYCHNEAIMRAVYEGGAQWARAERHYAALAGAPGEGEGGAAGDSCLPRATEARLTRFVRRWRAHFVAAVRPRALPSFWAVEYPVFQAGMRLRDKKEPLLAEEFSWRARSQ